MKFDNQFTAKRGDDKKETKISLKQDGIYTLIIHDDLSVQAIEDVPGHTTLIPFFVFFFSSVVFFLLWGLVYL